MSRRKKRRRRHIPSAPDERTRAAPLADGSTWVTGVQPVLLPTSQVVWFDVSLAPALNLHEAHRLIVRGEQQRRLALRRLRQRQDGSWEPTQHAAVFDALAALSGGVLLAYAAIEAYANEGIERLADTAMVKVIRGDKQTEIKREDATRVLGLGEKLRFVVPLITGNTVYEDDDAWPRFLGLRALRDELSHLSARGVSYDLESPSVYARLLRGEGSKADEDAAAVIEGAEPGWISGKALRKMLGLLT